MTQTQKNIDLPLSWTQIPGEDKNLLSLTGRISHTCWLALADVPENMNMPDLLTEIREQEPNGFLIRGCTGSCVTFLRNEGGKCLRIGSEAVLLKEGDHFQRGSIRELVRRGLRWGNIEELPYTDSNYRMIEELYSHSRYGNRTRLRYLFRNEFQPQTRCFALMGEHGKPLAALSISRAGKTKYQTELLVRSRQAPVGVMEALIEQVYRSLCAENIATWSLGEVPFVFSTGQKLSVLEKLVQITGHQIRFAYDYQGLFNFKNKFNPRWQDVYLCGFPSVSPTMLLDIIQQSGLLKLVVEQMRLRIRRAE
jgi:lysylphosphatidylglycerol synthetase-like protein (DUF2156 family)